MIFTYPHEPLYSNFPWFNCIAKSKEDKDEEEDEEEGFICHIHITAH